jgi:superoxide dismutase, Cu-Zn family
MRFVRPVLALSAVSLLAFAVSTSPANAQEGMEKKGTLVVNKGPLVIPIKTTTGDDAGTATFSETKNGANLTIVVALKNVSPGDHAIHIHQNPVCEAPDFKTAGGHFNPDAKQHGMDNPMGHHNGDLPKNITVGESHTGEITYKVNYLTLQPDAPNSVIGHSIMVHEKADDMKTDPTGNAGNRIACGVINAPAM